MKLTQHLPYNPMKDHSWSTSSRVYPHDEWCLSPLNSMHHLHSVLFFPVFQWWMNELASTAFMATLDTSGVIHLVKYRIHLNKLYLIWATFVDRANLLSDYIEPSQWHPCQFIQHVLISFHQHWMSISLAIFIWEYLRYIGEQKQNF